MKTAGNNVSLLIDTTSCTVMGLYDGSGNCLSRIITEGKYADAIDSILEGMLTEISLNPESIDKIVLANGPGSFTGLRVGIAYAQGFCLAGKLPIFPFNSFLPHKILLKERNQAGAAVISAKRGYYYAIFFNPQSGSCSDEEMITQDVLLQMADNLEILVASDLTFNNQMDESFQNILFLKHAYPFNSLISSVLGNVSGRFGAIEAHYVQKPVAAVTKFKDFLKPQP